MRALSNLAVLGGAVAAVFAPALAEDETPAVDPIRGALAERPYDTALYRRLYDAAASEVDGAGDQLHWGKWLHWSFDYGGDEAAARAIGEELAAIDPSWNRDAEIVERWRKAVREAADEATRDRAYRVAGHMLGRLLDLDPRDAELGKAFESLYAKAGESATGGAFTAERVRRRSPKWIREQNRKHAEWEDAFSRRTKHYKVITNISYEFFETVSVVMEEMFDFYQHVFDYNRSAPTVTLAIHRKRSDFDRYCLEELGRSLGLGTGGWFADWEMTVAAYDRSETAEDLTALYRTLFHEASHQFMYLITKKKTKIDPPTWLNEGTASYFEGCELKADGSIVKNKPALNRVREWESIEGSDRRHSLEDLITVPHRDYDGSYYSYGWALVYFLNNYEDEEGELVYRDAYLDYLRSYTKKGAKDPKEQAREAFDRAVEYFVEDVADPKVADWQAFEDRWRAFTQNVVAETKKGPEFADTLHGRCERYLARGDFERALIFAEQADDRRPGDPKTCRLMALANAGLGRTADAVYWMLLHWELAWSHGDDEAARTAVEWLRSNDAEYVAEHYCHASGEALSATLDAIDEVGRGAHPVLGLLFGSHAQRAFGVEHAALTPRMSRIQDLCEQDLRLWIKAYPQGSSHNRNRDGIDLVRYERDGVLLNNPVNVGRPVELCRASALARLGLPFEVRGRVIVEGQGGALVQLGVGAGGRSGAALSFRPYKDELVVALERSGFASGEFEYEVVAGGRVRKEGAVAFHLNVTGDGGVITAGDVDVDLPKDWDYNRLVGRMGLTAEDATIALFGDLHVRPGQPFWPVEPQN